MAIRKGFISFLDSTPAFCLQIWELGKSLGTAWGLARPSNNQLFLQSDGLLFKSQLYRIFPQLKTNARMCGLYTYTNDIANPEITGPDFASALIFVGHQ